MQKYNFARFFNFDYLLDFNKDIFRNFSYQLDSLKNCCIEDIKVTNNANFKNKFYVPEEIRNRLIENIKKINNKILEDKNVLNKISTLKISVDKKDFLSTIITIKKSNDFNKIKETDLVFDYSDIIEEVRKVKVFKTMKRNNYDLNLVRVYAKSINKKEKYQIRLEFDTAGSPLGLPLH